MNQLINIPKPFIFVLMPFSKDFDDIYQLGIKQACDEAGAYAERVDEQYFEGSILDRIYNQISKSDIIIADMTGRNPNVFYEVGYAHALGKNVFLLTKKEEDIPFDLKHYPHIVYGGRITELKKELLKRIIWSLENPSRIQNYLKSNVEIYFNNTLIKNHPTIEYYPHRPSSFIGIELDFHNSTTDFINREIIDIGIITKSNIAPLGSIAHNTFKISDTELLHRFEHTIVLLPDDWSKLHLEFARAGNKRFEFDEIIEISVRTFLDNGTIDHPFNLLIKEKLKD